MTGTSIDVGKGDAIALAIFLVLVLLGRWTAAAALAIGWSLRGDGKIFRQGWAQARTAFKRA